MRSEDVPVLKSDLFLAVIMLGTGLVGDGAEAVRTVPEYRLGKDGRDRTGPLADPSTFPQPLHRQTSYCQVSTYVLGGVVHD